MREGRTKSDVLDDIAREREAWRRLVGEVGADRMEEPGPMGDWSFKDLAAHLLGWRERTIARLESAAVRGETPVRPSPWPADLDDDDAINEWIHDHYRHQPVGEILDAVDRSYERIRAAVERIPDEVIERQRFEWAEGTIAEMDLFGHLHDEHDAPIRDWLRSRGPRSETTAAS